MFDLSYFDVCRLFVRYLLIIKHIWFVTNHYFQFKNILVSFVIISYHFTDRDK